jgi:hypothetical protein
MGIKTRNKILEELEERKPLEMNKVTVSILKPEVGGITSYEQEQLPGERTLLWDIAQSIRLLIDAVVETWQ